MMQWGFGGGGFHHGHGGHHRFEEQYHCYSVSVADKSHMEKGDKILLPPSAFDTLARLQVDYPMLFRLTSTPTNAAGGSSEERVTHCGVLEFTAEEGSCYIPFWMMQNLLISEGTVISVTNVSLPKASFVKLQPQSTDFLEISNPRAVLEHALRNFSCVTKGDIIQLPYNNKNFQFELKEVKPQDAVCIIETDCNVDFDAPVGYQEPDYRARSPSVASTGAASSVMGDAASSVASSMNPKGTNGVAASTNGSASVNGDAASTTSAAKKKQQEQEESAIRIVDGSVVVNEDYETNLLKKKTKLLAEKTGATGLQKNAAVPDMAPKIDYWACSAGHGARLDGKKPAQLKDKDGNVVDEQQIRDRRQAALEAAQRRNAAEAASNNKTAAGAAAAAPTQPISKRKTKVGKKYSRLKQTGLPFNGNANTF